MKPEKSKKEVEISICPQCKDELVFTQSAFLPFECKCGEWKPKQGLLGVDDIALLDFEISKNPLTN